MSKKPSTQTIQNPSKITKRHLRHTFEHPPQTGLSGRDFIIAFCEGAKVLYRGCFCKRAKHIDGVFAKCQGRVCMISTACLQKHRVCSFKRAKNIVGACAEYQGCFWNEVIDKWIVKLPWEASTVCLLIWLAGASWWGQPCTGAENEFPHCVLIVGEAHFQITPQAEQMKDPKQRNGEHHYK